MGRARVAAWGLWGLTMACLAAGVVLAVGHGVDAGIAWAAYGGSIAPVSYATIGALIASRRPQNPMGWAFLVASLLLCLSVVLQEYSVHDLADPLPGSVHVGWVGSWMLGIPLFAGIPLMFLLFPDGRLPSKRWRWVVWPLVPIVLFIVAAFAFRPGSAGETLSGRAIPRNPFGLSFFSDDNPMGWFIFLAWFAVVAVTAAAPVVRWRRATGEERSQLKWFGRLAGAMLLSVAGFLVLSLIRFPFYWVVGGAMALVLFVGIVVGLPVAFAVGILKHGLLDIDVVIRRAVVFAILGGFITIVYVALIFLVPAVVTGTATGFDITTAITVGATAVTALLFQPVRARARRFANRLVYGERASPYEVLSEFSERIGDTYSTEDVLPRMVRILASGTGARAARVWLRVGDELRPVASWPTEAPDGQPAPVGLVGDALPSLDEGAPAFPVVHAGELLGAVTVTMPPSEPFGPEQERLARDLAAQAGLVLRNVALTEELRASLEEVRASRQRIVTAADRERRKLERDIHDGAQQHLVALSVKLGLLQQLGERGDAGPKMAELAGQVRADATEALETLRTLARGIYPPLLAESGLPAALSSQASRSPIPASVEADGVGRYPPEVEAAAYFCCLEALQNAAKYSGASRVVVSLAATNGSLSFRVRDDGAGFDVASTKRGAGLQNMADRVEALGGTIAIESARGGGTTMEGTIPVGG